jgi:hypothetical protein
MAENTKVTKRASDELRAAGDALSRVNALLNVIEYAVSAGEIDKFSVPSLIETAIELTSVYAERAEGAAEFFVEVNHG